ncbi:MAG: cation:proton antiporter, partial [Planctomycetota bacterium]
RHALHTGLCLAQVGEFSFVLAVVAHTGGVLSDYLFQLVLSATIATLFLTPYLIAAAPILSHRLIEPMERRGVLKRRTAAETGADPPLEGHIVIVGYGPAGQSVAETLVDRAGSVSVVDLNPRAINCGCRPRPSW